MKKFNVGCSSQKRVLTKKYILMMKLMCILVISSVLQLTAATNETYSQTTKISLRLTNASLEDVIWSIKKQTQFNFFYNSEDIHGITGLDIKLEDATAEEIISECLKETDLSFEIVHKAIIIRKANKQVRVLPDAVIEQQPREKEVKGTVKDTEGLPLPGVSIVVKGTTIGIVSDSDGNFSLLVPVDAKTLVFSFVGMKSQEVDITGKTSINVVLEEEMVGIEEVVAVGYGTMKKSDVTGAISSVNSEQLMSGEPTNILRGMSGKVAGVQITQHDGAPGGGFDVIIRGGNSLTAGSLPLYIVDGFEFAGDLNEIDPNQIEAIEILKDASATAIYGARAANGVIIITTKTGKTGDNRLDINASYGLAKMSRTPEILTPPEFLQYAKDYYSVWYPYQFDLDYKGAAWEKRDENTPYTIWIDELTQIAPVKNVSMNFLHGSKSTKYGIGGNFLNQEGILKRSLYSKQGLNAKIQQTINDKLEIGASLSFTLSKSEGITEDWSFNGMFKKALQTTPFLSTDWHYGDAESDLADFYWQNENLLTSLEDIDTRTDKTTLSGYIYLSYEIFKDIKFYTSYSRYQLFSTSGRFVPSTTAAGLSSHGYAKYNRSTNNNWSYQARLHYKKTIGSHKVNLLAAFEANAWEYDYWSQRIENYSDESRGLDDWSVAMLHYPSTNSISESTLASWLGRLSYSYLDRYLLTASLRADGASKFGANNKWGLFPSVALAWRMSEESFIKSLSFVNNLKLRASFGVVGNNQIPTYRSLAMMQTVGYTFDNGNYYKGRAPLSPANVNLGWESTEQVNFGLDLALFDSRVNFILDLYNKHTTDMLLDVQLPMSSGYNKATMNVGSLRNRGFEFAISTINIDKKIRWSSNLTFSLNRSKILDLGESTEMYFSRGHITNMSNNEILVKKGYPIGIIVGYIEDGVLNNEVEMKNSPYTLTYQPVEGYTKLVDVNGDGLIDGNDKVPIAYTAPLFVGGFNNTVEYKNFDLSITMRYSYGNDVVNPNTSQLTRSIPTTNKLKIMKGKFWSPLHPENNLRIEYPSNGFVVSSMVEDGSFLKCDNIVLGYNLNKSQLNKLNFKNLRLYFNVSNPFIITRYSWYDPEANTSKGTIGKVGFGIDLGAYPRSTTYTLGVNIGF
ncbi:Outer membrane TonB-dependent transporter, utilization system for glycans and polysaccharides (PUL), SusC family [hydrothermal vent metagenome]|uniref:Outer membrane TonB-dependent transporter, utilization system for glycans and polysaccharides (PUL), SusC family n=1 Tax=hydrothermal vent metagenome TaxID=652676 RepID=A0A3B0U084_9ZZZZ